MPDMREGEVLWVDPAVHPRIGCPNGFPFRVIRFAGRGDGGRFWVHGAVLDPTSGVPVDETTILVSLDQQRAVRRGNAIRARRVDDAQAPLPAAAGSPGDPVAGARVVGVAPPGYRRIA